MHFRDHGVEVGCHGSRAAHTGALGGRRVIGKAFLLDHAVRDIHPEAIDTAVEPETQDAEELLMNPRVLPVEVGLRDIEDVEVPLAGCAIGIGGALPHRPTEDGFPVVGGEVAVRPLAVVEHIAVALRGAHR